jgi:Rhodopirellula transposase DDE domain
MGCCAGGERADDQRHSEPTGVSVAVGSKDEARKKIAATDAIFENVARVNQAADANPKALRISIDSKAALALGDFSRGGQSRV